MGIFKSGSSGLLDDFANFGKAILGGIAAQYGNEDYDFYFRRSGVEYHLTYQEHMNCKDMYTDQFGDWWYTEDNGETFYKY